MSADVVKMRVKAGANEVEIEAPIAAIKDALNLLPELVGRLPREEQSNKTESPSMPFPHNDGQTGHVPASQPSIRISIPEIQVERGDSLTDVITKIFRNSWGRQPRKLGQVREVLDSRGLIYPKQSIAVALLRLAQSGRLRRFKNETGEFVYTASTALENEVPTVATTGKD